MSRKIIAKVFLFITGCVLLLGGGVCTLSNSYFAIFGVFNQQWALLAVLMTLSMLAMGAGWKLITLVTEIAKLFAIFVGSLLLLGGGLSGLIMAIGILYKLIHGENLDQLFVTGIFLVFALLGYGLIRWADPDDSTVRKPVEFNQHDKDDKQ